MSLNRAELDTASVIVPLQARAKTDSVLIPEQVRAEQYISALMFASFAATPQLSQTRESFSKGRTGFLTGRYFIEISSPSTRLGLIIG